MLFRSMQGTGDMPEAWGNANALDLLRDMLVQERTDAPVTDASKTTLHLLAGLPVEWIARIGETASVDRTPTTLGTVVSMKLTRTSPTAMHLEFDPGTRTTDTYVHVPLPDGMRLAEAKINGRKIPGSAITLSANGQQVIVAAGDVSERVVFDFTFAAGSQNGVAR